MNIYVGNLPHEATEDELKQAFLAFGEVESVTIIKDRTTGEPRGFGFIQMPVQTEAEAAITGLDGTELKGQKIIVSRARSKNRRRPPRGRFNGPRPPRESY
ncbi:RNA-binding protein [candidate division KSB1 bacterium]|nr:RNA-binding protein [candidate division KSB1 bacterium]